LLGPITSRAFRVQLELDAAAFVPDGRHSIAELSLRVVFLESPSIRPDEDLLPGRRQVNAGKPTGTFSKLV
jgi:hypothetical protein